MLAQHATADLAHPFPPAFAAAPRRRAARDSSCLAATPALLYQPRRSLRDGALTGAEAQPRLAGRRQGPIAPRDGQLRAACTDAAQWAQGVALCIGVTAGQLQGDALIGEVAEALLASRLAPERLVLSAGEPVLADIDTDTLLMLSALRDLGVGIELDDFAAECGSMVLLKRLPLTGLKLSSTIVHGIAAGSDDAAIAQAVIAATASLGLTVVADGVETEAQRGFLASCGCDAAQGELFGYAMPASVLG